MSFRENGEKKTVSIVVPVYNEHLNIEKFYEEVTGAMETTDYKYEIIFVDDGSGDATPLVLSRLTRQDDRVRALILARNFAASAGDAAGSYQKVARGV